jgi:hypothetical protein
VPDPRQHSDRRNVFESLLRYIPGFRGYLEKEYRRESDSLARTWMADRLQESKRDLDQFSRAQVDAGNINDLPSMERIRARIDQLVSTLRGDVRGYSGFFDYVRIDESVLDRVYENDMSLLEDVKAFAESVEQLRDKPDTPRNVCDDLQRRLDDLFEKYQVRRDLLIGIADKK